MSSRAFRRLNRDADVIKISENAKEGKEEAEEEPEFISVACKKKAPVANPFALVSHVGLPRNHSPNFFIRSMPQQ